MFNDIKISTRFVKVPILLTGIFYFIISIGSIGNLFTNITKTEMILPLITNMAFFSGLTYIHFIAFKSLNKIEKIVLRSSNWHIIPNTISTIFLLIFLTLVLTILLNILSIFLIMIGFVFFIVFFILSLGSVYNQEWYTLANFTYYPRMFYVEEYRLLDYFVPQNDYKIAVVAIFIFLVLFIIPTFISILIVFFKKLMFKVDSPKVYY